MNSKRHISQLVFYECAISHWFTQPLGWAAGRAPRPVACSLNNLLWSPLKVACGKESLLACPYIPQVMRTMGNTQLFSTVKCQKIQPRRSSAAHCGRGSRGVAGGIYVLEHGRHAKVQLRGWRHEETGQRPLIGATPGHSPREQPHVSVFMLIGHGWPFCSWYSLFKVFRPHAPLKLCVGIFSWGLFCFPFYSKRDEEKHQ